MSLTMAELGAFAAGASGLGQYTFRRTRRGVEVYEHGMKRGTVSEARARQIAQSQASSRYQQTQLRWKAQQAEGAAIRELARSGKLPQGVRTMGQLRQYQRAKAAAEARASRRQASKAKQDAARAALKAKREEASRERTRQLRAKQKSAQERAQRKAADLKARKAPKQPKQYSHSWGQQSWWRGGSQAPRKYVGGGGGFTTQARHGVPTGAPVPFGPTTAVQISGLSGLG